MTKTWMMMVLSCACVLGLACAPESETYDELDDNAGEMSLASDDVELASTEQSLMPDDAPGPAACKADCMDVCNQDGQHFSACSSSCQKACHPAGPIGGGGGGQNQICLAGNKVWEGICKTTGVLQAACIFSGGCSGCRKKMDKNC